jgi:flagellar protein FliO/FliZ
MRIRALIPAFAAALAGVLLTPALAAAANGEQTPLNLGNSGDGAKSVAEAGAGGGSLVRTIVGLVIVIAVIYGLTWVLRQLKARNEAGPEGTGLRTLATLPLGTNRSLHLVRAGEEVVLVGSGEHGVTPIRTYTEAEARALGLLGEGDDGEGPSAGTPAGEAFGAPARRRKLLDEIRRRTVIR